jgi:hypothetical protein
MTLKTRRFLYISFILLFLIISPLVCLYASGYDLNFKRIALQKTGMLLIDSDPKNALATVKNEMNDLNLSTIISKIINRSDNIYTPAKIKKLLPGEYKVKVEHPGYWPWEKKLDINPGESTFAENIKLFKNGTPVLASNGKIINTIISNNFGYMLIDQGQDAILLSLSDDNELWPTIKNDLKIKPVWSPDDKKILVGSKIFDINSILSDSNAAPEQNLIGLIPSSSQAIKWGFDDIFYLNKAEKGKKNITELIAVNIAAGSSRSVFSDKTILDYYPASNRLFTIEKNNRSTTLNIYDQANFKLLKTINLPTGDYVFKKPYGNFMILADANHNIYILDPEADEQSVLKNKIENADELAWKDKENIFYYNDFEIWQMNLANNEKKIITRISSDITAIFLLPTQEYIIYSTKNNIFALELDERDHRNLTKLADAETIKFPVLNSTGDTIYFYSKINGTEGYFKLDIR